MPHRQTHEQVLTAKQKWNDEVAAKAEYQILNSLVTKSISANDAIEVIIDRTNHAVETQPELTEAEKKQYPRPSNVGNLCYNVALCVLECAQRNDQEKLDPLVDLVAKLQDVGVKDTETGELVKVDDRVVWTDLPTFGYTFADELGSVDPQHKDLTPYEKQRWERLTVFCAKLSVRTKFNLMLWALTALYYAFGPWEEGFEPESTDFAVKAACLWFVHAADKMWTLIDDESELWEDYTLENWRRWKECLVRSMNDIEEEEETGRVIKEALDGIEQVEGA